MLIKEGYMPYLEYQTYYRIVGEGSADKKPLLLLHGGPGSTHNYFELLDVLADEGRMLIMYDQLGCGKSAIPSRPDLWHAKTWVDELTALREYLNLEEVHLLGHSWGGMLLINYLCDNQPKGVKSGIFSSTLSSSQLWGKEQHRLIGLMDEEDQKILLEAEKNNQFDTTDYLKANQRFMTRYSADEPTEQSPEPLRRKKVSGTESYITAWGPNEFSPMGTLKQFDYTNKLQQVDIPIFLTSGTDDLSTPLINKTMYDQLRNARWELFERSRHLPFVDEREKYIRVLSEWLNQHDA